MDCAYFVSDIHLSDSSGPNALVFLNLLASLRSKALAKAADAPTHLFLVGDIFDLWIGSHEYFAEKFAVVIEAIEAVAKAGVEVHFFEGNHDFHLHDYWPENAAKGAADSLIKVHSDEAYFDLAGQRVRVEHGDLINPDDHGYLFLRWFLRTPVMKFLALNLPSTVVKTIGERASRASRHHTSTSKELPEAKIKNLIHEHAIEVYREEPFDLIISGHVHVVDDALIPVSGIEIRSVNLGSWYGKKMAFVLTDTKASFIDLV